MNSDFLQGENSRSSIGQRLCIVSFLEALLSENFFVCRVLSSVVVRVLLLLVVDHRGALFILCFLLVFWLCVSLMSLDILLVQMSGVINIFAILIYSFSQKINKMNHL